MAESSLPWHLTVTEASTATQLLNTGDSSLPRHLTLAECEAVSGGWGPGYGVLTAVSKNGNVPGFNVAKVTENDVGGGKFTAPGYELSKAAGV
jgi:hypothetical protein